MICIINAKNHLCKLNAILQRMDNQFLTFETDQFLFLAKWDFLILH